MPQLDVNTFLFQYISLVILFVFIYILLSYIVLPLILRAIILREKLLLSGSETKSYYLLYNSSITFNKTRKLVDLDWVYLFVEKLNTKSFPLLWCLFSNNNFSFLKKEKFISIPTTIDNYLVYINLVLVLLEEEKIKKF